MDNNIVTGNHGTQLRLESLSRQQNNKIVKCEVSNKIGKSEETETLNINCEFGNKIWSFFPCSDLDHVSFSVDAPKFTEEPKDVSGERDQDATLTCLVDGNPAPSYTWFKNGDFQTVSLMSMMCEVHGGNYCQEVECSEATI